MSREPSARVQEIRRHLGGNNGAVLVDLAQTESITDLAQALAINAGVSTASATGGRILANREAVLLIVQARLADQVRGDVDRLTAAVDELNKSTTRLM